nr:SDR family oxidoreductase [Rhizobium sp. 2MFCol3.1]
MRVNSISRGPIWTLLILSIMVREKISKLGEQTMIGRAGQPAEVARAYLIPASELWSCMTGAASWLSTKGTFTTTNKA